MDEIILKLLKENGRVIIPDFGALIVKQKSPFTVIFNEFLQYNDGALITAISTAQKIEREKAAEKVKQLSSELSSKLNNGETIDLKGIGVLSKTLTGKIELSEIKSTETKESQKSVTEQKETVTEKTPERPTTVEFDIEPTEQKPDKPTENEIPIKKPLDKKPAEPQPEKSKKTTETESVQKPLKEENNIKPSVTPSEQAPITEYYNQESSRNKLSIFLWITLIVIINGSIIIGFIFYFDEIKAVFSKKSDKIETIDQEISEAESEKIVTDDSLSQPAEEELIISDPEEEPEENTYKPEFAGTKYFVVAGVFKIEENADKLAKTLREKGYNAEKFGKIGTMFAVSYDVFPSKKEADSFMFKIKSEVDADAWIKVID